MIVENLTDRLIIILIVAATLILISGIVHHGLATGWIEGFSIYMAIFMIVSIASGNDFMKERQFIKLLDRVKDAQVSVIRGKYGLTQSVNVYDLVVGDIIMLETGMRVPADCLLLEGTDLSVDEKYYFPEGEKDIKNKNESSKDNMEDNPDPFILT